MLGLTIFESAQLSMIVPTLDRVLYNKDIVLPQNLPGQLLAIVNPLIEKINSIPQRDILYFIVLFIPFMFFFKGLFTFFQTFIMNIIGERVVRGVRNSLYAKFHELSLDFYTDKRTGELISRITNDVPLIANALSYGLKDLVYESMRFTAFMSVALVLAYSISWKLMLYAFVILPVIIYPVTKIGKRIKKFSHKTQEKMADLNSLLTETIQGASIVKLFNREEYELNRFKNINQNYYKFTLKVIKRLILVSPLTEFICVSGAMVLLWIVVNEVIAGKLSPGMLGWFLAVLFSASTPMKKLANVHAINQKALPASERIYSVLEKEPTIKEVDSPVSISSFSNSIEFDSVYFAYEEDRYVLEDINLEVKQGEVIALVGHSGTGKSTLVSLIPRLYDVQKGKISIDGIDIKELKLHSLRGLISVVSQEMVLFNATVEDNIRYGREGATKEEIIEAAKKAHAFEFIQKLPRGFSTVIGDRGFKLSGGEKQRLSIARAILKNSPILILDEATSHLDSRSEKLIQGAFSHLMKGKTTFVIAHRLSTVQKANRIVVLEDGKIKEIGTHSSLVSENTLYKKLYELQFKV